MSFFTSNITVANPIPQEVKIYYSKDFAILNIIFLLFFMGMGIFLIVSDKYFFGIIICLIIFCVIAIKAKGFVNNKPQIIINTAGLETSTTPFYKWSEITEEKVSGEYAGKNARPILEYKYPGGKERLKIEPLNIRPQDLNILLKYYRKPWEFNTN